MSNYYSKKDAKVRIAEELFARGWEVLGFKEDESDSMTDYYSPANWGGIAIKNGYILVVDNRCASEGQDITRYNPNYISMSSSDSNKIEALKNMTVEKGATVGEEANAKKLIEKINNKYSNEGISKYEVIGRIPAHMANSKGCIWHIEKDGALVDKGNQLTIFKDVPDSYVYDINKMEYKEGYKNTYNWIWDEEAGRNVREEVKRTLSAEEEKAIKAFKTFILRIERAVNGQNSCGDGTVKTEKEGLEQQQNETMKKITVEKKKEVVKMEQIERIEELKINDIVFVSGSGYCKVYEVCADLNMYRTIKLGRASGGYKESKAMTAHVNLNKKSFDGSLNRGYLKVYNLVTVEETEIIEKWVKVKAEKKTAKKVEKEVNIPVEEVATDKEEVNNITVEVKYNSDKNGIELYFDGKPSEAVREGLKAKGFRWSKFQKMWYVKDSEEIREYLKNVGFTSEGVGEKISFNSSEVAEDIPEININDIETYKIDERISKQENNNSMFRSKDRDHEKEIQGILLNWNNRVIEALEGNTSDMIQYKAFKKLQSLKKKYYNIYVKMLVHRANNPSWMVTGRGGLNVSRYNKKQSHYEKMMGESVAISKQLDDLVSATRWNVKRDKKKTA